jgi:hypothetical protein
MMHRPERVDGLAPFFNLLREKEEGPNGNPKLWEVSYMFLVGEF